MSDRVPSEIVLYDDFMCICGVEGKAEAETVLADVKDKLGAADSNLLKLVVVSLEWDFDPSVSIVGIYNDQWFGVFAESYLRNDEPQIKFSIECDRVEHGIARLWQVCDELATLQSATQTKEDQ